MASPCQQETLFNIYTVNSVLVFPAPCPPHSLSKSRLFVEKILCLLETPNLFLNSSMLALKTSTFFDLQYFLTKSSMTRMMRQITQVTPKSTNTDITFVIAMEDALFPKQLFGADAMNLWKVLDNCPLSFIFPSLKNWMLFGEPCLYSKRTYM